MHVYERGEIRDNCSSSCVSAADSAESSTLQHLHDNTQQKSRMNKMKTEGVKAVVPYNKTNH